MKRMIKITIVVFLLTFSSFAVEPVRAVRGTISRIDSTAKTVVVKTADGTGHTLHFVAKTTVHGTEATAEDTFHGLKEGTEVVAHYIATGGDETAVEIDRIGKGGMKAVEGSITDVDRAGKRLVVKSTNATEQTFRLTDHAAVDAAKGLDKATEKSAKVTVYYTEDAGKKIAHFFEMH
jgi:hypothetical protein